MPFDSATVIVVLQEQARTGSHEAAEASRAEGPGISKQRHGESSFTQTEADEMAKFVISKKDTISAEAIEAAPAASSKKSQLFEEPVV